MSEWSDKESIQEVQSVNGDEDLRMKRNFPPHYGTDDVGTGRSGSGPPQDSPGAAAIIGTGGSGVPKVRNNADATIDTGWSGIPPDEDIRRAQPFSFELPLWLSEETQLQHHTTNQDDESKKTAAAGQDGEHDEVIS
jgi:hypothetical protein